MRNTEISYLAMRTWMSLVTFLPLSFSICKSTVKSVLKKLSVHSWLLQLPQIIHLLLVSFTVNLLAFSFSSKLLLFKGSNKLTFTLWFCHLHYWHFHYLGQKSNKQWKKENYFIFPSWLRVTILSWYCSVD